MFLAENDLKSGAEAAKYQAHIYHVFKNVTATGWRSGATVVFRC